MELTRLLVVQHAAVWQILPFFLLSTLLAGVLTGWLAALLLEELREPPVFQQADGALTNQ